MTKIEWVKNPDGPDGSQGITWNPITGCLNGCEYCYARKLANTRLKLRYIRNFEIALPHENPKIAFDDPFYPRFWEDRLEVMKKRYWQLVKQQLKLPKKMGVFTCDMSDLFGIGVPEEWTRLVLEVIRINNYDRFYLLTKQPQNLIKFSPYPDNCWVGVSATNRQMFKDAVWDLMDVKATVKYVSFEPLLDWAYSDKEPQSHTWYTSDKLRASNISWVIIGAQTKPYKPPKIEWVQEIVEACDKAGIPVFLKDNLLGNAKVDLITGDMEWAFGQGKDNWERLRQEFPE